MAAQFFRDQGPAGCCPRVPRKGAAAPETRALTTLRAVDYPEWGLKHRPWVDLEFPHPADDDFWNMTASHHRVPPGNLAPDPFDPDDGLAYAAWREAKLSCLPCPHEPLLIEDPHRLNGGERQALLDRCRRYNFTLYRCRQTALAEDKSTVLALGRQLGLARLDANLCADEDAVSAIRVNPGRLHRDYIPYTDHPLNWHTDGYYNTAERRIRGFILHCVRDAEGGGDTAVLDPDIAYIHLRDTDPPALRALMHPRALTIPANTLGAGVGRPAVSGPVFWVDPATGCLVMRYTARSRSVSWRDDPATRRGTELLRSLLDDHQGPVVRYHLRPGEGLVCNNVLHCRTGFEDGADGGRMLYRARYLDRVADRGGCRRMEGADAVVE